MLFFQAYAILFVVNAAVAELADALDSGSSPGCRVGVQVPSAAPCIDVTFDPKTAGRKPLKTGGFLLSSALKLANISDLESKISG